MLHFKVDDLIEVRVFSFLFEVAFSAILIIRASHRNLHSTSDTNGLCHSVSHLGTCAALMINIIG